MTGVSFDTYLMPMWFVLNSLYFFTQKKSSDAFHLSKSHTGEIISACVLGGCTMTCCSPVTLNPQEMSIAADDRLYAVLKIMHLDNCVHHLSTPVHFCYGFRWLPCVCQCVLWIKLDEDRV